MKLYTGVKRCLDFVAALGMVLVISPVLLLICLGIKVTSPGPVFFKQRRIGKDKKEFEIYKFRTMRTDTPSDVPTHLFTDAQFFITPIGKILRKTSLDELPQLINVLKGEMSFIGPRPALWNQFDLTELRDQYNVHSVLPGITGWAQVNGRDEIPLKLKSELDGYYVEHMSLALDIKILIMTFTTVLTSKGVAEGGSESIPEEEKKEEQ